MSVLSMPPAVIAPPMGMPLAPRLDPSAQWQAAIEPDWSITITSAISGSFCRSRTPMSTGSVSSRGVFW